MNDIKIREIDDRGVRALSAAIIQRAVFDLALESGDPKRVSAERFLNGSSDFELYAEGVSNDPSGLLDMGRRMVERARKYPEGYVPRGVRGQLRKSG